MSGTDIKFSLKIVRQSKNLTDFCHCLQCCLRLQIEWAVTLQLYKGERSDLLATEKGLALKKT